MQDGALTLGIDDHKKYQALQQQSILIGWKGFEESVEIIGRDIVEENLEL
jgi:hypothetical protein